MSTQHVVIVGSGPIGASYARLILESTTDARVTMFELGPQLTDLPGLSVRNIVDPDARAAARAASQGPQAGVGGRLGLGIPSGTVVEGTFTARQGTHLIDFGGEGSGHAPTFPAAAVTTCVGGQGAHWTCATPRPEFSERVDFIADDEWTTLVEKAESLLHVTKNAFADSTVASGIRTVLQGALDGSLPEGFGVVPLPVAGDEAPDGSMRWTGTDVVLGPLTDPASPLSERFTLVSETLVRRLIHDDGHVTGVEVEDRTTGGRRIEGADQVVVAADALRSPQLLFASGIRPMALGHYLTEHPSLFGVIALDGDRLEGVVDAEDYARDRAVRQARAGDPIAGVNRVSFSEPTHPYSAQVMYLDDSPLPIEEGHPLADNAWGYVNLGWGGRKFPRYDDAVTFDEGELDYLGMPAMTIDYALTDRELDELERAREWQTTAQRALGEWVPGGEPRLMPAGSSLHYQGTMRLGAVDDGTSVADPWSRVWGFDNLRVGGNGLIPTATAVNPTLFSVALAVRGAQRLVEHLD